MFIFYLQWVHLKTKTQHFHLYTSCEKFLQCRLNCIEICKHFLYSSSSLQRTFLEKKKSNGPNTMIMEKNNTQTNDQLIKKSSLFPNLIMGQKLIIIVFHSHYYCPPLSMLVSNSRKATTTIDTLFQPIYLLLMQKAQSKPNKQHFRYGSLVDYFNSHFHQEKPQKLSVVVAVAVVATAAFAELLSQHFNLIRPAYSEIDFLEAGKTTINSVKIVLKESVRRISKTQKAFDLGQEIVLRQFPIEVPIGSSMPLQDKIMIPASVLGYTAIGNIISRAYFLELVANVNCCYSDLRASRHVIVNNDIDPPFQQQNNKKAPFNWNPKIGDSVYFLNLQPYDYNPCASIGALNQSGASNHMIGIANYLSGEVTY